MSHIKYFKLILYGTCSVFSKFSRNSGHVRVLSLVERYFQQLAYSRHHTTVSVKYCMPVFVTNAFFVILHSNSWLLCWHIQLEKNFIENYKLWCPCCTCIVKIPTHKKKNSYKSRVALKYLKDGIAMTNTGTQISAICKETNLLQ